MPVAEDECEWSLVRWVPRGEGQSWGHQALATPLGHSRLFLPFEPLQVHFWKTWAVPMLEKSPLVWGGKQEEQQRRVLRAWGGAGRG